MARLMQVDLVDSEKQIFSGDVEYLVAPGAEGEVGIFPHHIPLISKLKPGVLRLQVPGEKYQVIFAISGGFLEVQNNHATILADIVERTEQLDEARLNEQTALAKERILHVDSTLTRDVAQAQAALDIAIAQLKALDYIKKQAKR